MTPESHQVTPETNPAAAPIPVAAAPKRITWFQRLVSVLLIVFCLELGLFLLVYPWTDSWSANYFSTIGPVKLQPYWQQIWNNGYLRGAFSGLGLLNIWVAVAEALRMFAVNDRRN